LLPSEFGEFKQTFANKTVNNKPVYIVKPEAGCQGRGIFLTNNPDDLEPDDHYVVQQYIKKPLLIEDLKFDCRLYVMIFSIDPMRIYLYKEGLARFSTDPYKAPSKKNMNNMFMHLTNYAINAKNKGKFIFNKGLDDVDTGHKRIFTSVLDYIRDNYDDGEKKVDEMMHKIEQLIIKTMCTVQPSLKHYLTMPNKA
jgi:tubulin polyglutamylase TTLL6/13